MIGVAQKLGAYQAVSYTWDEPSHYNKLVVEIEKDVFRKEYNLEIIKSFEPEKLTIQVLILLA